MIKKCVLVLVAVLVSFSCVSIPLAHPGKTDSAGGHWDHSTGEYHYHHGYPAHQHIDGVCPYNFEDQTNHNGGNSSKGSPATAEEDQEEYDSDSDNKIDWAAIILCIVACSWLLIFEAVSFLFKKISDFFRSRKNKKNSSVTNALPPPTNLTPPAKSIVPNYRKTPMPQPKAENSKEWAIVNNDHIPESKTEDPPIEEFNQKAKSYCERKYGGKTKNEIAHMCGMPINAYISKDNLPCSNDPIVQYTFYIAPNGKSFHRLEGCSKAFTKVNVASLSGLKPCQLCNPARPDLLWYYKYLGVLDQMRKYGIDIKD